MRILLCNDDGFDHKGIRLLAQKLSTMANVRIVAPNGNRSGYSHSLSFHKPVKLERRDFPDKIETFSIDGTPADCVQIAHHVMKDFPIDLVVAGVNDGYNLGSDVYYSGTVGIAMQAAVLGYRAVAFSAPPKCAYLEEIIEIIPKIIKKILTLPVAAWNVNFPDFPPKKWKGFVFTNVGVIRYTDSYEVSNSTYTLVGEIIGDKYNPDDTDVEYCKAGYVTVSPISLRRTDEERLKSVRELGLDKWGEL